MVFAQLYGYHWHMRQLQYSAENGYKKNTLIFDQGHNGAMHKQVLTL